ncbi:EAL domain-containing protein [Parasalinivibrio latis]|uniref:two-component system response regulator n=1 Tax=Parasalinivibrio latis TaxID=2952610 RepID=UPI0030DF6AD1
MVGEVSTKNAVILVVDDDPVVLANVSSLLAKAGHRVLVAKEGEKAIQLAKDKRPDLVLLDIHMPGLSGIEICNRLKSDEASMHFPVIFLTGSDHEIEDAFNAGGVDYILKPFRLDELMARVHTHIKISRLRTSLEDFNLALKSLNNTLEEKVKERTQKLTSANNSLRLEIEQRIQLQQKLDYLSRYDFVTHIYNRRSMMLEVRKAMQHQLSDADTRYYFIYLDLDQFRVINDSFNRSVGDRLMKELTKVLQETLDEGDVIARMGGDEFGVLTQMPDIKVALQKTFLLKQAVEAYRLEHSGELIKASASYGLVEIDNTFDDAKELVNIAERTCFQSKDKGGGEITVYNMTKSHIEKNKQQMRWVPVIQRAIENDDLLLCGQKIIDIRTGDVKKAEMLVRMRGEDGSIIPPNNFIPVAERFHLISSIDQWVLDNTLQQIKQHNFDYQLAVNVSGETIAKSSFAEYAENLIRESGIDGSQICFEITETSVLTDIKRTNAFIERLRRMGCKFALDDFGTGTSSYAYLKELDVDVIKIDGLFVRDLVQEKISRMMVESVVAIACETQRKTVAECVEDQAALDLLRDIGVDYAQGFFIHRPALLSEIQ